MPWSAEQREWLQALGYDLLVRTPQAPYAEVPPTDARETDASVTAVQASRAARVMVAPNRAEDVVDPLLRAMLRAARSDALDEVRALAGDVARLRTDPIAKRAAWPRLRALRAGRRP